MPLMSEGKDGPSPRKMREIWRREERKRIEQVAYLESRRAAGREPSATAIDLLKILEDFTSGASIPVGVIPAKWRAVCQEMRG